MEVRAGGKTGEVFLPVSEISMSPGHANQTRIPITRRDKPRNQTCIFASISRRRLFLLSERVFLQSIYMTRDPRSYTGSISDRYR